MNSELESLEKQYKSAINEWLSSCKRNGIISRNTIAVGLVVIDHLDRNCTVKKDDVITSGGEVKGARSGLGNILEKYGVPSSYLKEVTTRQAGPDAQRLLESLDWGEKLCTLSPQERDALLLELVKPLSALAHNWLNKQNLKLDIDRRQSPSTWVHAIVENAKSHSGGVVEQHLVGAKLERRFKGVSIPNFPAHAADAQTERDGDFTISGNIYHVTASPGRSVIQKCAANIRAGNFPILLVSSEQENKAKALAEDEGIDKELTIISIESFVALNIIELAIEENKDFFKILKEIVDVYNRRLEEVETDMSLHIEVD